MTACVQDSAGLRVLLTRSEEDCAAWAEELERRGIASVSLPCIATEPIDSPALRRELAEAAQAADWIAFTSRRGVEAYARLTAGERKRPEARGSKPHAENDASRLVERSRASPLRVAVVGAATAEATRLALGRVDLVAEGGTAHALAQALVEALREGARVLLAVAENARDTLETELRAASAACRRLDVYRTVPAKPSAARRPLASLDVDAVLLASPSAVQGFVNQVEPDASAALVVIGPTTSAAARRLRLEVAGEAREPTLEALLDAIPRAAAHGNARVRGGTQSQSESHKSAFDADSSETETPNVRSPYHAPRS